MKFIGVIVRLQDYDTIVINYLYIFHLKKSMLICIAFGNVQVFTIIKLHSKEVFAMLNENMKTARKSKGFSQEELAIKLNVVRQTVSKWEQGLSVPDSDMLISLSDILETPVSTLLGERIIETNVDDMKTISKKLEIVNLQLARGNIVRRKIFHCLFILLFVGLVVISASLVILNSPYLGWNYLNPETAVIGVSFHAFEWLFVRFAPIILIGAIVGIFSTRRNT